MRLATPEKVQKLQRSLYVKAKGVPTFRFYALYDKVFRKDVLFHAYALAKTNKGAAGIDGITFSDVEAQGLETWIGALAEELKEKRYRPTAVRRVFIPKRGKGVRPLGIPTIRDRVVQAAAVLILEPIFEADLEPEQYAYRPKRSAHDALRHAHKLMNTGHTEVIEGDLSGYFDTIPHDALMKCLSRRISDGAMLALIKSWLRAPVIEKGNGGGKGTPPSQRKAKKGIPQGAPISPLLANIYIRRFVLGWKVLGHAEHLHAQIVNYADDFIICCKGTAEKALEAMQHMMNVLQLIVNHNKTRIRQVPTHSVEFLGYDFVRCYSHKRKRLFLGTRPSKKKVQAICRKVSELLSRRSLPFPTASVIQTVNRTLIGWSNYFCLGCVSQAYRAVENHTRRRLRQWLCWKHKVKRRGISRFPDERLHDTLGLLRLQKRTQGFPWAKTDVLV